MEILCLALVEIKVEEPCSQGEAESFKKLHRTHWIFTHHSNKIKLQKCFQIAKRKKGNWNY